MVNSLNNRWFSLFSQDVRMVMRTKHAIYNVVFVVVTNDNDVMPSFIFLHILRLNMETDMKYQEGVELTWIGKVTDRNLFWQQDCAPGHKSKKSLCWQRENFCDRLTP